MKNSPNLFRYLTFVFFLGLGLAIGLFAIRHFTFVGNAQPVAEINPELPHWQSTVHGQTLTTSNIRNVVLENGDQQIAVDVCFNLMESGDWTLNGAYLTYYRTNGTSFKALPIGSELIHLESYPENGTQTMIERKIDLSGKTNSQETTQIVETQATSGFRCELLRFAMPQKDTFSDIKSAELKIAKIVNMGEPCTEYLPLAQAYLKEKGVAIEIACEHQEGLTNFYAKSWPKEMSQEEAERLIRSEEIYSRFGPWLFTIELQ
ncbi:MAG TPA: hypothetical protein PK299_15370 [Anaerolineales bacterium]|nr:hypothetical protein [Anaerolineales bacterium]